MKHTIKSLKAQGVKFLHFRVMNDDGTPSPVGGATAAYVRDEEEDTWHVGYALCRTATAEDPRHDTFNRKLGCLIAGGRAVHSLHDDTFNADKLDRALDEKAVVAAIADGMSANGLVNITHTKK